MSGVGPLLFPTAFTAVEAEDVRTWTELEDELDSRCMYQLAYIEDKAWKCNSHRSRIPFSCSSSLANSTATFVPLITLASIRARLAMTLLPLLSSLI